MSELMEDLQLNFLTWFIYVYTLKIKHFNHFKDPIASAVFDVKLKLISAI